MNTKKNSEAWLGFFLSSLVGLYALCVIGCTSTITPKQVTDNAPSWDGTNQNSGFLGYAPDGYGVITPRARDRYNALVDQFAAGKDSKGQHLFLTPPARDAGLEIFTNGTYRISPESLSNFGLMNHWRKQGTP
jgi:hypothetical protein